jgi:hypothetical protein
VRCCIERRLTRSPAAPLAQSAFEWVLGWPKAALARRLLLVDEQLAAVPPPPPPRTPRTPGQRGAGGPPPRCADGAAAGGGQALLREQALEQAGLDEGLLSLYPPILVYIDNTYRDNTCQCCMPFIT